MTNYRAVWDSINAESAEKGTSIGIIARFIPTMSLYPLILATDVSNKTRYMYIGIMPGDRVELVDLNGLFGMDISVDITSLGPLVDHRFIKIKQTAPKFAYIFEAVMSDICESLTDVRSADEVVSRLKKKLQEWKFFFEKRKIKKLNFQQQKGLFCELEFIRELVKEHNISPLSAVRSWVGPDKASHDFSYESSAIEIKSTSGKDHSKVKISSERQLDNKGFSKLILVAFLVDSQERNEESCLTSKVDQIRKLVEIDVEASHVYEIKLIKAGYVTNGFKYNKGIVIKDKRCFKVVDGFPRITIGDYPQGVGDIKYSVILSAAKEFEIKMLTEEIQFKNDAV